MADFYTQRQLIEIMASHQQSVTAMEGAARQLGDQGRRSVQLWAMATALVDAEDAAKAGEKFSAEAATRWEGNKTNLVTAIDALALSTGLTRGQILDDLKAAPETKFD